MGSEADVEAVELEGGVAFFLGFFLGLDAETVDAGLYENYFCWTGFVIAATGCR